ncbi:peptidylprolyl isomerase [bacterium]|nr:peptidylprolyl isomerase [bacterium]
MSEEIRASHILVETLEEAQKIKDEIEKGEKDFELAAAEYSLCPSGSAGGDLGFFGRGMMVKPFEEAAFSLEKGVVSEPVKTQFGYHLIMVTDAE